MFIRNRTTIPMARSFRIRATGYDQSTGGAQGGGTGGGAAGSGATGGQQQGGQQQQGQQGGQQQGNQNGGSGEGGTPVQLSQERLETIISQAYARGAGKAEQTAQTRIAELEAENARLKGGNNGQGKGNTQQQGNQQGNQQQGKTYTQDEVQALISEKEKEHGTQLTEAQKKAEKLLETQLTSSIIASGSRLGAIDAQETAVLVLANGFVRHDEEGKVEIVNEKGQTRFNSKGEPMSLDEFMTEFLAKRPHLKRGANTGGTGSHSQNRNTQDNQNGQNKAPRTWAEAGIKAAQMLQGGSG